MRREQALVQAEHEDHLPFQALRLMHAGELDRRDVARAGRLGLGIEVGHQRHLVEKILGGRVARGEVDQALDVLLAAGMVLEGVDGVIFVKTRVKAENEFPRVAGHLIEPVGRQRGGDGAPRRAGGLGQQFQASSSPGCTRTRSRAQTSLMCACSKKRTPEVTTKLMRARVSSSCSSMAWKCAR